MIVIPIVEEIVERRLVLKGEVRIRKTRSSRRHRSGLRSGGRRRW